jgi:hypothetical protein
MEEARNYIKLHGMLVANPPGKQQLRKERRKQEHDSNMDVR